MHNGPGLIFKSPSWHQLLGHFLFWLKETSMQAPSGSWKGWIESYSGLLARLTEFYWQTPSWCWSPVASLRHCFGRSTRSGVRPSDVFTFGGVHPTVRTILLSLEISMISGECWRLFWCAIPFYLHHKALSYIAWHVWKDLLIWVFHLPSEPHWPVSWFVHWRALQTPSIVIHSSTCVNIFFKIDVSVHKASRINRCFDFCFDVELFSQSKTGQCLGVAKQCEHSSRWTFRFTK